MSRPSRWSCPATPTSTPARSATSTRRSTRPPAGPAPTSCCSSPPTGSRPSTTSSTAAIPDKGEVLTQLSLWWFDQLADLVPNHVVSTDVPDAVAGRAVLVRRLEMLPVECIARAYLTGGGLGEYREHGAVCGVPLPAGLVDGVRLPEPIFTPTTKAPVGEHDLPMTYAAGRRPRSAPTSPPRARADHRRSCGAATRSPPSAASSRRHQGRVRARPPRRTPTADGSSSPTRCSPPTRRGSGRPTSGSPGAPQPSFDKQFVRDWLTSPASGWDRSVRRGAAAAARGRRRARPARSTSRPTSGSPAGRSRDRPGRRAPGQAPGLRHNADSGLLNTVRDIWVRVARPADHECALCRADVRRPRDGPAVAPVHPLAGAAGDLPAPGRVPRAVRHLPAA